MSNLLHNHIKPILRKFRSQFIGDDWKYQIKPIAWYNFLGWIQHTISEDRKFYRRRSRPMTLARWQGLISPNLKQPIFIFGSPRSGTTFLGACLGELPELSYHFEPVLTKAAVRCVYTQEWSHNKAQIFYRTVYSWLMRLYADGDLRFADKTPRLGFILPFLYATFPDAKFIHIIRDGRDVAISLAKRPWYRNDMNGSGAKDPGGYPFGSMARFWVESDRKEEFETTNDIHRCIWLWRKYVTHAQENSKVLPSSQYHELKYEDLILNPLAESDRLSDFMAITNPESRSLFKQVVSQKAKPSSIGGWETELNSEQIKQTYQEAGDLLNKLGYLSNSLV